MKPFNLQEALAGKPVVDRTGEPVTDFHYFKDANGQKLFGIDSEGDVLEYSDNGNFYADGDVASNDLFMASEKKEGWINVYVPSGEYTGEKDHLLGGVHPTEQAAKRNALPSAVATVRIEWEE